MSATAVGYKGCPGCLPDTHGRLPIGWCGSGCYRLAVHNAATDQRKAKQRDERAALLARLVRQQERDDRTSRVWSLSLHRPIGRDGGDTWIDMLSSDGTVPRMRRP